MKRLRFIAIGILLISPVPAFADVLYSDVGDEVNVGDNGAVLFNMSSLSGSTSVTSISLNWGSSLEDKTESLYKSCYGGAPVLIDTVTKPTVIGTTTSVVVYDVDVIFDENCYLYFDLSDLSAYGQGSDFIYSDFTVGTQVGSYNDGYLVLGGPGEYVPFSLGLVGESYFDSVVPVLGSSTALTDYQIGFVFVNVDGYEVVNYEVLGDSYGADSYAYQFSLVPGVNDVQFTVSSPEGSYYATLTAIDEDGMYNSVVAYSTFMVATTTVDSFIGWGYELSLLQNASTTDWEFVPNCRITPITDSPFDLAKCLYQIFVPSNVLMADLLSQAKGYIFEKAPIGYATRLYDILVGEKGTSSLPSLVVTIPDGLPGAGASLDLTPWDDMAGPGSMLGEAYAAGDDVKFLDRVLPYWEWGWKLLIGFWILFRVIGFARRAAYDIGGGEARAYKAGVMKRTVVNTQKVSAGAGRSVVVTSKRI